MTLTDIIEAIEKLRRNYDDLQVAINIVESPNCYTEQSVKFAKRDIKQAIKVIGWTIEDLEKII